MPIGDAADKAQGLSEEETEQISTEGGPTLRGDLRSHTRGTTGEAFCRCLAGRVFIWFVCSGWASMLGTRAGSWSRCMSSMQVSGKEEDETCEYLCAVRVGDGDGRTAER